jgi:hypothetical protein
MWYGNTKGLLESILRALRTEGPHDYAGWPPLEMLGLHGLLAGGYRLALIDVIVLHVHAGGGACFDPARRGLQSQSAGI